MALRPNFTIDLRSKSHGSFGDAMPSPRSLASPRLHVAGDIPPELSPLDAFAAQSRLLAKQLEESNNGGRRVSRLPPLTIANSLNQNRPGYFRSISADGSGEPPPVSPGTRTEVETPAFRPKSVHPTLSGIVAPPSMQMPMPASMPTTRVNSPDEDEDRGRKSPSPLEHNEFFGARRDQSPSSIDSRSIRSRQSPSHIQPRTSNDSMGQRGFSSWRGYDGSLEISGLDARALAPPRSPYNQRTASPMSLESSEDDPRLLNAPFAISPNRKFSSGSGALNSPVSPTMYSTRSPSISSEISAGGTYLPRPSFNFSRPISRASMAGSYVDIPMRQASSDSQPSFILADDTVHTPISLHSEGFPDVSENAPAPSYVYSKFSLPRGKMLQRNSRIFQGDMPLFQWEQPVPNSNVQPVNGAAPPSPPSRPSTSSARPDLARSTTSLEPERPSLDSGRPLFDRSVSATTPSQRPLSASAVSEATSSSTLKPSSQKSLAPSATWSAEEHVEKAIEFHEAGALTKSTYHLRLAARQHHPTGMLLYALACRHGWGMRPNQAEGVQWLRKAADAASVEVAGDEDMSKEGKPIDFLEQKARKAQFALSIYELGVSHMNGWGIEQDKVLALRCFEIAGSWGDADALAEAGFFYAQGIGCKKNLKKSAKFYRAAEAKGISMVGNSWIYKSKYNEDEDSSKKSFESRRGRPSMENEKSKKRDKSRNRGFFGRKNTH